MALLFAITGMGACTGRHGSQDDHAAETQRKDLLLWFGDHGTVVLDGRALDPARWRDSWRAALAPAAGRAIRVGADDGVSYARVHEAYAEAWRNRIRDVGYAIDRQGRSVALSELERADVSTPPGPHVLAIAADGRLAWDGVAVDEPVLDHWMKTVVMPKRPQDSFVALIELKVDPQTPYGTVKRLLNIFAGDDRFRVAGFEESENTVRNLIPLPPMLHIPPPGTGCKSPPRGITCQ